MTGKPRGWPPEPGDGVWVSPAGDQFVSLRPGRLSPTDNVAAERDADEVWESEGPLIAPSRLSAALRQHAHEIECRTSAAARAPGGPLDDADRLYRKAEQVSP